MRPTHAAYSKLVSCLLTLALASSGLATLGEWPRVGDRALDVFPTQALALVTVGPREAFQSAIRWRSFRTLRSRPTPLRVPWSYCVRDAIESVVVQILYATYPRRTGRSRHSAALLPFSPQTPILRVLAAYPRSFRVRWEINPHMKTRNRVNQLRAVWQWENLIRTLRRNGVEVHEIEQHAGLHDMVFTANAGVLDHDHAAFIPAHFAPAERQPESALFTRYFQEMGYWIDDVVPGSRWEGEGDSLVHEDHFHGIVRFGGYGSKSGFRSELKAQHAVATHLRQHFVALELVDPRFYHLDTCFFPLGDGMSALYYPQAFSEKSRLLIEEFVTNPIAINETDALAFACNGIAVNHVVIMNHASPHLKEQLKAEGFRIVETPMSEFLKSGGSVKCLLLLLNGWLTSSWQPFLPPRALLASA